MSSLVVAFCIGGLLGILVDLALELKVAVKFPGCKSKILGWLKMSLCVFFSCCQCSYLGGDVNCWDGGCLQISLFSPIIWCCFRGKHPELQYR